MSFFGDVHAGIRTPDTVMNSGPLPPQEMGGMPYGLNGTPDARINYNSSLLGDIDAYAYGEPDRLSTQSSYINIPNRIQKVVPKVYLPGTTEADDQQLLTHAVDDGDVCFAWRDVNLKMVAESREMNTLYGMRNYHPFVNLATVNYLLAGLQLHRQKPTALPDSWRRLWATVNPKDDDKRAEDNIEIMRAAYQTWQVFGVAHGSEKQGGGHEGTVNPVTWASNFVTTMYVDGYVRNLANLWRHCDFPAGARLVLQEREVAFPKRFTLNHYGKNTVVKQFPSQLIQGVEILQLCPCVEFGAGFNWTEPYMRVAMSYVPGRKYAGEGAGAWDDSTLLRGALLEGSFQPQLCPAVVRTVAENDYTQGSSNYEQGQTHIMPAPDGLNPANFTHSGKNGHLKPMARLPSMSRTSQHKEGRAADPPIMFVDPGDDWMTQMPPPRAVVPARPALDFKRYAREAGGRPTAVPAAAALGPATLAAAAAAPEPGTASAAAPEAAAVAPEAPPAGVTVRKSGKKRLQASVLGTSSGGDAVAAEVL